MKAKKALQFLDRRILSTTSSLVLLLAMVAPAFVPAFASADEVTARSITVSSSAINATNVTYDVKFTTVNATTSDAFIVDFCSNSAIYGDTCTAPSGLSTTGVGTTTGGATASSLAAGTVEVVQTNTTGTDVNVVLTGIANPSSAGVFYARIVTFDTSADAASYTATGSNTGALDEGSVALTATNSFVVSATVEEALQFCITGNAAVAHDCSGTLTTPNLALGTTVGDSTVIDSSALYTGSVYTQLSTNAVGGAVVNLKSSTTGCGGLLLVGGSVGNCYIKPAIASDGVSGGAAAGKPYFGLETLSTSTNASGASDPTGTLVPETGYGASTYFLNYVTGDATGVTSVYGDPVLDTDGAPASNQDQTITFGASVDNTVPAGNYQATLDLIATGTY